MSREQSVSTTLRAALIATLVSAFLTSCIFSPEKKVVDTGGGAPEIVQSPEDLIKVLEEAYRTRDIGKFSSLLANDPDNNAEYLFILDTSSSSPDEQWDYNVETRIHQRMFEPQNTPAGQSPVPSELWLVSISITLTQNSNEFTERTDLYFDATSNPTGLSRDKWHVSDAIYATDVYFQTQGELDFQVTGRANFVVIEDLTKEVGAVGKFLILQWNDLGSEGKPGPSAQMPS